LRYANQTFPSPDIHGAGWLIIEKKNILIHAGEMVLDSFDKYDNENKNEFLWQTAAAKLTVNCKRLKSLM